MSKPAAAKPASSLKLRRTAIDTYRENVAYLHRECGLYRAEGFQALSKIEVSSNKHSLLALLNVVNDPDIVAPGELGLADQAFEQLGLTEGSSVRVDHAEPPQSMEAVSRKIAGERLNAADFRAITKDIVENRYSKMEMAAFLVASGQTGLDRDEVLFYTEAMADSGRRLNWHEPRVVDKHCIGGIPGNRTSMLVVPIVAAHGMLILSPRAVERLENAAEKKDTQLQGAQERHQEARSRVAEALDPRQLVVVIGCDADRVEERFRGRAEFVVQSERRGTGDRKSVV